MTTPKKIWLEEDWGNCNTERINERCTEYILSTEVDELVKMLRFLEEEVFTFCPFCEPDSKVGTCAGIEHKPNCKFSVALAQYRKE